ncbi:maleylpyruvate isomerase N-terminal domain-containing protein [Streptomyces sp. LN325]|uniref:maleylpyruvate isomerase N-terminal domain-containing protein n=1 Tax=Streptomyces sp. LN325 TaxID=3112976 RepID=UPI00371ED673
MESVGVLTAAYGAFAGVVTSLSDEESWLPSGCTGWAVRDLVFHCLADAQRGVGGSAHAGCRACGPRCRHLLGELAAGHGGCGERATLYPGGRQYVPGVRAVARAVPGDCGGHCHSG